MLQLRDQGLSFKKIGDDLGVSATRARSIFVLAERRQDDETQIPIEDLKLSTPIKQLPISQNTRAVLRAKRFASFEDITLFDRTDFTRFYLALPNANRRSLNEILALLDFFEERTLRK